MPTKEKEEINMPDRRQSDRRQSSGSSKKQLTISLSSFVYICIIFALVICFIFKVL